MSFLKKDRYTLAIDGTSVTVRFAIDTDDDGLAVCQVATPDGGWRAATAQEIEGVLAHLSTEDAWADAEEVRYGASSDQLTWFAPEDDVASLPAWSTSG